MKHCSRIFLASRDALVLALAAFCAANVFLGCWDSPLDANRVWVGLPSGNLWTRTLLGAFAFGVLGWRWHGARVSWIARCVVIAVAGFVAADVAGYYAALTEGRIHSDLPLPLSLVSFALLIWWAVSPPARAAAQVLWGTASRFGIASAAWLALFVGSIALTDYARPADAAVVFGARVWRSGEPSNALADRLDTAIGLHQRGLVPVLVFSGGRDPRVPVSEPQAMRRVALEAGVEPGAILLDEQGNDTEATVARLAAVARERGWSRVLAVSDGYHLARIRLAAARHGLEILTVPCERTRANPKVPLFVLRELAAWTWYWVRPIVS